MTPIYLLIGVPCSGKSWVCEQLSDLFEYVSHDAFMDGGYVEALFDAAKRATKPVLAETPFSISQIKNPLEAEGCEVIAVFIIEDPEVLAERYEARESREIPKGHLTRQNTYTERAEELGAFIGTSEEVFSHLRTLTID